MIITIGNLKGGVGKSTVCIHLLHYLNLQGFSVALIDTDAQQSSYGWAKNLNLPNVTLFKSTNVNEIEDQLYQFRDDFEVVIVDTAGSSEELLKLLMSLSEQVLIPLCPASLDVKSSIETIKHVVRVRKRTGKPISATLILNKVIKNTNLRRDTIKFFGDYDDIELSTIEIPQTQRITKLDALKETAFTSKGCKDLAEKYTNLFNSLLEE